MGHTAAVVAVRFNPRLFHQLASDAAGRPSGELCCVVAVGSQDCKLTVWLTSRNKPVVVLKHFFDNTVVDMAWTPDGYTLLCCSLDGSVGAFTFSPAEVGKAASHHEAAATAERLYGAAAAHGGRSAAVLDDAALLAYSAPLGGAQQPQPGRAVHTAAAQPPPQQQAATQAAPGGVGVGVVGGGVATSPQREFRGADGRRRIVPQLTGPAGGGGGATAHPQPPPAGGVGGVGGGAAASPFAASSASQPPHAPHGHAAPTGPPHRVGGGAAHALALPHAHALPHTTHQPQPQQRAVVPHASPAPIAPPGGAKRKAGDVGNGAVAAVGAAAPAPTAAPPSAAAPPRSVLPLPPVRSALCVTLSHGSASAPSAHLFGDASASPTLLEARNTAPPTPGCALLCTRGGACLWSDALPFPAVCLAGCSAFSAAATTAGDVVVYSPCGRRALPPLCIGSPAAFLSAAARPPTLLACASACGTLWVWTLSGIGSLCCEASCALREPVAHAVACLRPSPLAHLRLSPSGSPVAIAADGNALVFDARARAWARLAAGAVGAALGGAPAPLAPPPPPPSAARPDAAAAQRRGRQLEALLSCGALVGSGAEVTRWTPQLARHLADAGDEARLREMLTDLAGPSGWAAGGEEGARCGWDPTAPGGVDKRTLLAHHVLPAIAQLRGAQRIAAEFADRLAALADAGAALTT